MLNNTLLLFIVSLPPFKITQFPLFMQRDEICIKASGLASKITPITPIGQVSLQRVKPSSNCLCISCLNKGSSSLTKSSMPAITSLNFVSSNFSRLIIGAATLSISACFKSIAFASKISCCLAFNCFTTSSNALFLASSLVPAILGEANLTAFASSFIFILNS